MSYLRMLGQVASVFERPKGVNRQGDEYGGTHHVQLLAREYLANGDSRLALFTLRTDHPELFKGHQDEWISCPVGAYCRNGELAFFLPRGQRPELARAADVERVLAEPA